MKNAKYLAPVTYSRDVTDFDDEKWYKEASDEIDYYISNDTIPEEAKKVIDEHELMSDINTDILIANQATFTNMQSNISIEAKTSEVYSFALSQTGFRILYDVILTNVSDVVMRDLVLKIESNPSYVIIKDINVPLLQPHQPILISEFDVEAQIDILLKLTEKQIGNLTFTLYDKENEVSKLTTEMSYYSYDTWIERIIPNSTALFVMPNEESVKNIVRLTAKTLEKETGRSSLDD